MEGKLEVRSQVNKGSIFFFEIDLEVLENSELKTTKKVNRSTKNNSNNFIDRNINFKIPDVKQMKILHDLALLGNMKKIKEHALVLKEVDNEYSIFADRLQTLAKGFQEREILLLIEKCLEDCGLVDNIKN